MPLTEKIYNDFYMKEIAEIGIKVEYWDLSTLFFKETFGQEDSSYLTQTKKIKSYKELSNILSKESIEKTLFFSIMSFEGRVAKLFRMLTYYNCTLAVYGRNIFPLASSNNSQSNLQKLRKINYARLLNYFQNKYAGWLKLTGKIKKYDILFLGGTMGWTGIGNIKKSELDGAIVVKVNSDDYDNALQLREVKPVRDGNYILFLDEYLPLHPDAKLFNIQNITPEEYYPELCRYFERVEEYYKMPVVIAAHPKALDYKVTDYFMGRDIYYGQSAVLSKFAFFVLAHDTTSINYPIAFGKKLHFITSENINRGINIVHENVLHFSDFLGCNYQWFDKEGEINLVKSLPSANYEKYKYQFQTWPETQDRLSVEIFIEFFK